MVNQEQRFKNYLDKRYNLYENADKDFYDSIVLQRNKLQDLRKLEHALKQKHMDGTHEYGQDFTEHTTYHDAFDKWWQTGKIF